MRRLFPAIVFLIIFALPAFGQLTGKIKMVGVPDRYKIVNKGQSTTGLTAVGVGQRVVMAPVVFGKAGGINYDDTLVTVTSAQWTFTSKPAGSTAVLADTGGASGIFFFIPDSVGKYVVSMTATTSLGAAIAASITISADKFVGESIAVPATNGIPNGCICHQGTLGQPFKDLLQTNHAQAVKRKLDDPTGHFGTSCMSCHSIGYDGVKTTNNNGWDDLAAGPDSTYVHWFPPFRPNSPGTFDSLVAHYPNLMARSGIQCENCHGAASAHVTSGDVSTLDITLSSTVCQPCHYSSDRHAIGYQWAFTAHANSIAEGAQVQYMDRFTCARCHTAQGFINEIIGGKPQPVASGKALVYPNPMPVGCSTCHDPHKNAHPEQKDASGAFSYPQLRVDKIGDACIGCHSTRVSSRGGLHTSNQGPMLVGTNAPHFTLATVEAYRKNSTIMENNVGFWGGWELPGYTYENSSHSKIEERCVTCHMAKSPSYIANENANFTLGDSMLTKLGRHTFMVSYTDSTGKTTLNPTGCVSCHGTVSMDFVESTGDKTQEMLDALYALLPKRDSTVSAENHYTNGTPISPTDTVTWQNAKVTAPAKRALTTIERAAAYNYIFVKNDGSGGVHNFLYAKGLLESSIEQLKLGTGAATIVQIKDVPADNGNAVQVVWNQFPAEQSSFGKLTSYGVWRRDPVLPVGKIALKNAGSFKELLSQGTIGGQYTMAGSVWTFVASVPASNLPMYSYIAPTLFDSTKNAGIKYTAFYIAGYTTDGSGFYQSPIDSGYSTNNLFPTAVIGVTASAGIKGVTLSWKQSANPQDNDVEKYVVFRGTATGFVPNPAAPYATVKSLAYQDSVVTSGTTYYYRIAAIDKAGNLGTYSSEISATVTTVDGAGSVPTDFALGQNYPNPFNPTTEIRIALPVQTHVSLTIYSITGSLVRTLVNNEMNGGYYNITWNGLNDNGQQVSTGMYFYRLQAGTFTESKKMLLVK